MRIASLLASATEIVYGLGLGDQLVAISHECDYPPDALTRPRVSRPRFDPTGQSSGAIDAAVRQAVARYGSVYELDADRLRTAAPDLILTQAVCEVCAVPTSLAAEAARVLAGRPTVISLDAHRLEDIFESIEAVGEAAGAQARAVHLVTALRDRVRAVVERVQGEPRPRVLALEWLDPPYLPGHWTPEMITLAGGENLLARPGVPSRHAGWRELEGLDPDVLLVMPCGFGLAEAWHDAVAHADRLRAVAPRAIDAGRAHVLDGSAYFNRSGPRAVDGIEILAALLHPARAEAVPLAGRAAVWRPH